MAVHLRNDASEMARLIPWLTLSYMVTSSHEPWGSAVYERALTCG